MTGMQDGGNSTRAGEMATNGCSGRNEDGKCGKGGDSSVREETVGGATRGAVRWQSSAEGGQYEETRKGEDGDENFTSGARRTARE